MGRQQRRRLLPRFLWRSPWLLAEVIRPTLSPRRFDRVAGVKVRRGVAAMRHRLWWRALLPLLRLACRPRLRRRRRVRVRVKLAALTGPVRLPSPHRRNSGCHGPKLCLRPARKVTTAGGRSSRDKRPLLRRVEAAQLKAAVVVSVAGGQGRTERPRVGCGSAEVVVVVAARPLPRVSRHPVGRELRNPQPWLPL